MTRTIIRPEGLFNSPAYSHAIMKSGTPVFIADQTSSDRDGNAVHEGDAKAQAEKLTKERKALEASLADLRAKLKDLEK
jgi:enamine deaminase RidA (YjgF/YER057c/UK114 family)